MHWVARARSRLRSLPDWIVDGAIALLLLGIDLRFNSGVIAPDPGGMPWEAVVSLVTGTLPLTTRRRAPRLVLAVVGTAAVLGTAAQLPVSELGLCVALFTAAAHCPRRYSLPALGLFTVVKVVAEMGRERAALWLPILVFSYGAAWVLGDQRRTQRALTQELGRRADQLERDREHRVRWAAADERARIARDLHDVVAHSVSVMVLHTAAARRTLSRDPRRAEEALAQVEATGRQSLAELRQLLGVLREQGQGVDLTLQPKLAYLDELVDSFREAGLPVHVHVAGDPRPLEAVVDLSAYRIVQEAMTNALKHANASTVEVRLGYGQHELRIEIVDDGRGGTHLVGSDNAGHGLVGMRERAQLVGGTLQVGHRPAGAGFRVAVVLPLGSPS